jgi:hypothetical protein
MVRTSLRTMLAALAVGTLVCLLGPSAVQADHPDIFYNFYQGPTASGVGTPAQLYVSPRPTPPLVGHTWITYPPLSPHEFLYHHHRKYYKYYRNGGWTHSHVRYHTQKVTPFIVRNTIGLLPL